MLDWSVGAARAAAGGPGDGVVVVVPPERAAEPPSAPTRSSGRGHPVELGPGRLGGGAGRRRGHRGPRRCPLAGAALFARVVGAVRDGADAAVPAVDVTDTLRHRSGGAVDRNGLVAVQTPQAFRASALRRAHAPSPRRPTMRPWSRPRVARWSSWRARRPTSRSPGRSTSPSRRRCSGLARRHDRHPTDAPGRTGLRRASVLRRRRPPAGPRRRVVRRAARACRAQRRGRDRPRHHGRLARAAGLGDIGQHFPDTDPAWSRCRLRRAPAAGGGGAARRRLVPAERRLHGGPGGTQGGRAAGGHRGPARRRRGRARHGQGQAGRGSRSPGTGRGIACIAVALVARGAVGGGSA